MIATILPWCTWPWNRCRSTCHSGEDVARCDLLRNHDGRHVAERGMYWIWWDPQGTELLSPGRDDQGRRVA